MSQIEYIPKTIHYCWFGGAEKNQLIRKCISSWKKYCPDYEIIEWNETNFDINCCDYVREAYEARKWAFVSDYARLWILYTYGGIYLDTDVELIKTLNPMLKYRTFFASEDNHNINTGIGVGSVSHSCNIQRLLESYIGIHFLNQADGQCDLLPCTTRNTVTFENEEGAVSDFLDKVSEDRLIIFSKEYFCPFNNITGEMDITDKTVAIHWFNASWRSKSINIRERLMRPLKRFFKLKFVKQ